MKDCLRLPWCALVACATFAAASAPALAERRPTVIVAERAALRAARESRHVRDRASHLVDAVLAKNQRLASNPAARNRLFATFNENNNKLQLLNFRAQQNLARIGQEGRRRLDNLEPDPEADQSFQDAMNRAQSEITSVIQSESARLQQMFSPPPPGPTPAPEENGFPDPSPN